MRGIDVNEAVEFDPTRPKNKLLLDVHWMGG